jgi:hypothetical protein
MKTCSIKGCHNFISETLSTQHMRNRWIVLRSCRCGAWDARTPKSCTCGMMEQHAVPTQYWPSLDWWAYGGVDEVILCPRHREEVMFEIIRQRNLDASMNVDRPSPYNRH